VYRHVLARLGALVAAASLFALLVVGGAPASKTKSRPPRQPSFPVTVSAANGKVTIDRQPRRIVSLSATATEDLYAIGAGSQLLAVDQDSDYPKGTPRTKLSGFAPNIEAIAGLRPDLVVIAWDTTGVVRALGKLHVPVLLEPPAQSFGDAYAQIKELGLATGHGPAAARLVTRMRGRIAHLAASLPSPTRPLSVYHEISPDHFSASSSTFIGSAYRLFGLRNIADQADAAGSHFPQLSDEYIIAADPDLIVLADTTCCAQSAKTVSARPGWENIAAVRRGAIVQVDDALAARWGPRIVDFVRAIARALRTIESG
jgi:iron complex transport system substrate-binding protein